MQARSKPHYVLEGNSFLVGKEHIFFGGGAAADRRP